MVQHCSPTCCKHCISAVLPHTCTVAPYDPASRTANKKPCHQASRLPHMLVNSVNHTAATQCSPSWHHVQAYKLWQPPHMYLPYAVIRLQTPPLQRRCHATLIVHPTLGCANCLSGLTVHIPLMPLWSSLKPARESPVFHTAPHCPLGQCDLLSS
jgi:hypothetical protein